MKYKRYFLFLLLLVMIVFAAVPVKASDGFNSANVYNVIKELSSDKYRGRLAGDKGNTLAQNYIVRYFKQLGLKPLGDNNTYLQKFNVIVPEVEGECYIKVFDKEGNFVKDYMYGKDFKEMTYGASFPGVVQGKLKSDLKSDGSILLYGNSDAGESPIGYESDIQLKSMGINAVLCPTTSDLKFRSPYKLQNSCKSGIIKMYVTEAVYSELNRLSEDGCRLEIKSTVEAQTTSVNNVLGMIQGRNPNLPPIILSAHFDHVGYDADGTIYPGAFDNASGTALLIECARMLKSLGKPERTIIFAAFNAEEVGLLGSKYFVQHSPVSLKGAECINFDMVGSAKKLPLTVIYSYNKNEFPREILKIARSTSTPAAMMSEDASDHAYFCYSGINAVTLIQFDKDKIHTPYDTIENVNKDNLRDVFAVLDGYLNSRDIISVSTYHGINKPDTIVYVYAGCVLALLASIVAYRSIAAGKRI